MGILYFLSLFLAYVLANYVKKPGDRWRGVPHHLEKRETGQTITTGKKIA